IWDSTTGECLHKFSVNSASMECLAFSPDGKTVAVGTGNGSIQLWDVVARRQLTRLSGHRHSVNSVAFSPDGKVLVSGSADRTVRRWDVGTSNELGTFFGHERAVMAVAFSPDGRLVASGGGSVHFPTNPTGPQRIRIWERATGQEALRLDGHDSDVTSLAFHPNGKRLAAG